MGKNTMQEGEKPPSVLDELRKAQDEHGPHELVPLVVEQESEVRIPIIPLAGAITGAVLLITVSIVWLRKKWQARKSK